MFRWFWMVFDGVRCFFWKVLDGGAVSINSSAQKTIFFEKMSKKVKVLDGGGGLNKFLGVKNEILKKYVPKCHLSWEMTENEWAQQGPTNEWANRAQQMNGPNLFYLSPFVFTS